MTTDPATPADRPGGSVLPAALVGVLEADRERLNQLVHETQRSSPTFDPGSFTDAVRELVAPIVSAVDANGAGFASLVAQALLDVALPLTAEGHLDGAVRRGWDELLPLLPAHLAADPQRVIASVTNALANLDRAAGARPDQWIELVRTVAPSATSVDELLAAGQLAAWRCGMAAYRRDALQVARTLPGGIVTAILGEADLDRFAADPWHGRADATSPVRVGGFRGFGGPFLRPPLIVGVEADGVVVTDGDAQWLVLADAFGSAVVRTGPETPQAAEAPPDLAGVPVGEITSAAALPGTSVVTSALTHAVLFLPTPVAPSDTA